LLHTLNNKAGKYLSLEKKSPNGKEGIVVVYMAREYEGMGNRRYVTGISSMLPNDEQEIDPLDVQHYLLRHVLKGNYLSPLAQPARILDSGCGTGRWLSEMALEFPQADLVGLDLTPIASETTAFPSNCHFQTSSVLEGLPFEDGSFDFVHQRFMMLAIPHTDWQRLVNELARVTRRRGWIELAEVALPYQRVGSATEQVVDLIMQAAREQGFDPHIAGRIGPLLSAAALKRVGTSAQLIPVGSWGGQSGALALKDARALVQTMKSSIMLQTQLAADEIDWLAGQMEQEAQQYHTTFTFHVAYGQRQ
jgi:2-polyprenyl-3-methyl-5-hydroxy-6-metoxy-1,4-benzoquinol methylase